MRHEANIYPIEAPAERELGRALVRGWRRRCPNCGGGPMMDGYLKIRRTCASCGEKLHHHRADDLPAYATIILVGKVVIGGMYAAEVAWSPPMWVQMTLWPLLALAMTLLILPRLKGMVVGMQWAWRMHGFGTDKEPHGPDR